MAKQRGFLAGTFATLSGVAIAVVVLIPLVAGCASDESGFPEDAVGQMEIAFDGGWSRAEIQQRVDQALTLYGEPTTNENRSRAASSLVGLRQQTGVQEMAILAYMICSRDVADSKITFVEAAAFSAQFIGSGDSCPTP